MLELLLFRHAKAGRDAPGQDDHERDLIPRGEAAAVLAGRELRRRGLVPALALCSTARRTLRTWALAGAELGAAVPVQELRELYLAAPERLLDTVRRQPGAATRLLLVGHNPGLHELAVQLTGSGPTAERRALAQAFPTAAVAWLRFNAAGWDGIAPAAGELLGYWRANEAD